MTIDPLYINGLLGSLLVVLLASLATLPLAAHLSRHRGLGRALALTPALGVLLLTAIAAVLYYLLPPANAAWIATLLTVALGVVFWSRQIGQITALHRNRLQLATGIVVAAALLISLVANRLAAPFPDESLHLGLSATIAAGNHPVVLPGAPDLALARPYAVDLHVALLAAVTGLPVGVAAGFQHAWLALASLLVVFALVRHTTESVTTAVIAAGLAAYAPGTLALGWSALGPDGAAFPSGFTALIDWFAEDGFRGPDLLSGPADLANPGRLLGLALAALLLQGWIVRLQAGRGGALVLGIGAGLLALVDSGLFFPTLLALVVLLAVEVARAGVDRRAAAARAAITLLAALLLATLLGGAITDALLRGAPGDIIVPEPHLQAALLDPRVPATALQVGHPALGLSLAWLHLFILALGLRFLRRDRAMSALLVAGVAGVALAHLFVFNPGSDATGAVAYSGFFTVLAVVIGAHAGLRRLPRRPSIAAAVVLILFVAVPTALPRLLPAIRNTTAGIDWRPPPPAAAQPAYDWIVANLPRESRILSPTPAQLTIATGRYGVFAGGWRRGDPYPSPDFIDRWSNLDGAALRSLGVTHLHVPTLDLARLPTATRDTLTDPARFELVFIAFDGRDPANGQRVYRIHEAAYPRSAEPSGAPAQLGPGPAGE
jgi:hypothetical protein